MEGLGSIFTRFSHVFGHVCRELAENLPRHTTPVSIANLLRLSDVGPRSSEGGGAAVVPPWGFGIRRPPQVWQRRAGPLCFNSGPICKVLTPKDLSEKFWPQGSGFPSLFLSPGARGPPEPRPQNPSSASLGPFWSIFCPSETRFKICFEKTSKKMRKSRISGSQNPPQIRRTDLGAQAC